MPVERRRCAPPPKGCGLLRQLKFFTTAKGRICITCQRKKRKLSSKLARALQNYGLTAEDYWALYNACGGRCMSCHGKRARLDIDHDHARAETHGLRESVRGLLCARCNRWGVPGVAGDPYVAFSLGHYLLKPPAHAILGTGKAA